jgi:hypothetical protein
MLLVMIEPSSSGQQALHVHGRRILDAFSSIFALDRDTRDTVEVIVMILTRTADEEFLLFIDEAISFPFAHLEIRGKLDRIGRACLFAVAAEDAPGKVDTKEFRIAPAKGVLCGLKGDTVDRARCCAKIAGHAALIPIRVT